MSLPLVHHVPHLHFFVVHGGMLPSDPRLSPTDPRQPLAHSPIIKTPHHRIGYDPDRDTDSNGDNEDSYSAGLLATDDAIPPARTLQAGRPNVTVDELRQMQESALLVDIPQNRDSWVVLNMRSVKKNGKITK